MKLLITILAFIWFLGWGFWFLYERGHIDLSATNTEAVIEEQKDTFQINEDPEPPTTFFQQHPPTQDIDYLIDSLMEIRGPDETIQVISYYDEREPYTGMNGNKGIQRSINLLKNASTKYASRVLQPIGLLFKEANDTTGISQYYQIVKTPRNTPIKIINDRRILIFFPFASDNERASSKITHTLDSLTNIWNTEKKQLIVTGYTDNTANPTTNYNLGLARAKSIQERIVGNGYPEDRITTLSRGEEEPISVNTTANGRYLNRRVEILVDK